MISIIVAVAENGVIGDKNSLLWHISEDLKHFKAITSGHPADEEIFIIGGAEIYAQALPLADKFYLTRVHHPYDGDTRFPEWNPAEWRLVACEAQNCGAQYPYPFTFETYLRR